jgi:regulatory protein
MLRYELLGRGIGPEAAEKATEGIDDGETALALARERTRKTQVTSYEAFVSKVGGFLSRRGFDSEVTARTTRQVWRELQEAQRLDEAADPAGE